MKTKRIIIIGGMGPQASVELHRRIIAEAARRGAKGGADFPEIVHLSLPIDDFISDKRKTVQALRQIRGALECFYPYFWRTLRSGLQYGTFATA